VDAVDRPKVRESLEGAFFFFALRRWLGLAVWPVGTPMTLDRLFKGAGHGRQEGLDPGSWLLRLVQNFKDTRPAPRFVVSVCLSFSVSPSLAFCMEPHVWVLSQRQRQWFEATWCWALDMREGATEGRLTRTSP
jgi:hypothetical protein